ncbi:MAG: SCO family protein [Bacteroidales bacterium]
MKKTILLIAALFVTFSTITLHGQGNQPEAEIGIVERLDEYLPEDIYIINTEGERENLVSLLDKPTAIAVVYYRCPGICSPFMTSMAEVVQNSNLELGKDYQILNISFDPTEGTNLSRANQNSYHMLIDKEFDPDGWRFFTTDSLNSRKLTEAVGFKYKRQGLDFLHTSAMIFVSDEGKITRYLHGTYFLPMDLKLAVVETAEGKSGPSMSRLLSYCYSYDPAGQAYVFNVTKVAGSIILFMAITIFLVLVLKPKRKTTN